MQRLISCLLLTSFIGCVGWQRTAPPVAPTRNNVLRGQLLIHSDFELPQYHKLLQELTDQRAELTQKLGLPMSDEPIHVYLFDNAQAYEDFIKATYPELPARRAFFMETDSRLAVYAHWSDRVAEDLRHEVTHGYLHSIVPRLPLWLDEGLAEYFEVPPDQDGLNGPHVELLAAAIENGNWKPDLQRLEGLTNLEDLSQSEYAESWLWIHWFMESRERRELLKNHLDSLRERRATTPLSTIVNRLEPPTDETVLDHLTSLQ